MVLPTTFQRSELDELCINTIRTLSMDAVQKANSGHPGTPMALAPLAYVLWTRHLKHNPADPQWLDRDRFVLSAGHASMLLYSLLYLTGYGLTLEDLKNFRQWESRTPGHPEYGMTPGVETTTGPLGQGFANGVGMAMAERHLAALFNRPGHEVIDHYTYAICSDGDLMEGVASEAASLAGPPGAGQARSTSGTTTPSPSRAPPTSPSPRTCWRASTPTAGTRVRVEDGNDLEAIDAAIRAGAGRPAPLDDRGEDRHRLRLARTRRAREKAHGAPLGEEEIERTKENLGWPTDGALLRPRRGAGGTCARRRSGAGSCSGEWKRALGRLRRRSTRRGARALHAALERRLPEGWDAELPELVGRTTSRSPRARRRARCSTPSPGRCPGSIGGSADLAESNNTHLEGEAELRAGRVRAAATSTSACASTPWARMMNGMALHGGVRPYGGTFLIFSDYMRPPIRLAALMEQPTVYVFTHDSVGLGEDGPTHQPVEQLAALRAIPGLVDLRPVRRERDGWRRGASPWSTPRGARLPGAHPAGGAPPRPRPLRGRRGDLRRGAYVLADAEGGDPRVILIASGSEVALALEARERLQDDGIRTRVVSMPSWVLFERQPREYRERVLPPSVTARVVGGGREPDGLAPLGGPGGGDGGASPTSARRRPRRPSSTSWASPPRTWRRRPASALGLSEPPPRAGAGRGGRGADPARQGRGARREGDQRRHDAPGRRRPWQIASRPAPLWRADRLSARASGSTTSGATSWRTASWRG